MRFLKFTVVATSIIAMMFGSTGCETLQANRETTAGAGGGAAAGAALGAIIDDDKRWRGALIGAAAGAAVGGGIGYAVQRQRDRYEEIEGVETETTQVQFPDRDDPQAAIKLRMPSQILFGKDSPALSQEGKYKVTEIAQVMNDFPDSEILIRGYASSEGAEDYNFRLSERRAEAVRFELIANGVAASRLYAQGMGEADPIASNDTEAGRAQNRRVEILVVPNA